jgi:hypothetical protein
MIYLIKDTVPRAASRRIATHDAGASGSDSGTLALENLNMHDAPSGADLKAQKMIEHL